jgi:hypothetical protein
MPWMMPPATRLRLRGLPMNPDFAFWAIAVITLALAWPVRYQPNRAWLVLAGSLLSVAWLLITLR